MRNLLRQRPMRLLFMGNFVSLLGSGMNAAALSWYVLQLTHSEISLGTLLLLQTVPMLLLAPFSGVLTDRMDRRHLVMLMDAFRAVIILATAILSLLHRVNLAELYAMSILVSAATSIFWPTTTALTQELTTRDQYVTANTLLMTGAQGGFLVAGALVGLAYNHVGLGGVLLIDVASYAVSLFCYGFLRRGRHLVAHPESAEPDRGILVQFGRDLASCIRFLRGNMYAVLLCTSSSILFALIFAQNVIVPSLADRILQSGAVGFGWLNAASAIGAFLSAGLVKLAVQRVGVKNSVAISMTLVGITCVTAPFTGHLGIALVVFFIMGAARGVSVVTVNTGLMQAVPEHYMGRVQNAFALVSRAAQIVIGLALGLVAHAVGLVAAFLGLALVYGVGAIAAAAAGVPPAARPEPATQTVVAETA